MNVWMDTVSDFIRSSNFAALFADAALKSFVVLAITVGICGFWRRASASTRHLIWFLAVASLPCLPIISSILPSWQRPLWSVSSGFDTGNKLSLALELAPATETGASVRGTQTFARAAGNSAPDKSQFNRGRFALHFNASWLLGALSVWFSGIVLVFIFAMMGRVRLHKISSKSRLLQDNEWSLLLQEAGESVGLGRAVRLMQSAEDVMPLTWGWLRPTVLLPANAEQWATERRRIVLSHELAHVKRWDCFTQFIATMVCAIYWFNPLVWLAARRMRIERERACDDLVLNAGCKPSDYAGHLVEIARTFRQVRGVAAIAMARQSQLEGRINAIVDATRRRRLPPITAFVVLLIIGGLLICIGADTIRTDANSSNSLRDEQIARLEKFSAAKEKQARTLARQVGEEFFVGFQPLFDAAIKGDWQTVTNMYEGFKRRHPQYSNSTGDIPHVIHWQTVLEICLAYDHVANCEPKYTQIVVDDILNSIPAGSIYFGGTDPGRGLPTAFCRSHADGDPFFTLTQNALADGTYLRYLREMYGGKNYTPTDEDSQKCFQDYSKDAGQRLKENKLKPGENVRMVEGKVQVSGQVAVMAINGLLTKIIFDKNPDREFYVEESFPLDWMYPHLEPRGLIMKINREPLSELPDNIVQRDHEYWRGRVADMIGGWLADETPVKTVADFAEKTYVRKDLNGFTGDPRFVQNDYAKRMLSKLRSSIGGVYAWRREHAGSASERDRMAREADFAFRQAVALCPYSPEAVFRYVNLLMAEGRISDALLIAQMAARADDKNTSAKDLVQRLEEFLRAK